MTKKKTSKRPKKQQLEFSGSMNYDENGLSISLNKDVDWYSSMSIDFDADGVYCNIDGCENEISWEEFLDAMGLITGSIDPAEYFDMYVDEDGVIQS